jgi:hypothetical protein
MYFTDTPELRKFEREMRQKPNFTGEMMIVMKMKSHIYLTTKMSIQTEKKTEVDFMTIKIRSPTQKKQCN